jgi:hypothetical protein
MPTTVIFAAGIFDNPWLVAAILLFTALANWLAKRREQKAPDLAKEGREPPTAENKPEAEFNLEEALRRLMGEEPPPRTLPPPPITNLPRNAPPPLDSRPEVEEYYPEQKPAPAPVRLAPVAVAQASMAATTVTEQLQAAARRFEQLNEQGRHPATVTRHTRTHRSRVSRRSGSPWRNPSSARQAFVASIVFAPPKSLEL